MHPSSEDGSETGLSEAYLHLKTLFFKNTCPYRFLSSTMFLKTPSTQKVTRLGRKKKKKLLCQYKGILVAVIVENKLLDVCQNKEPKNYKSTT